MTMRPALVRVESADTVACVTNRIVNGSMVRAPTAALNTRTASKTVSSRVPLTTCASGIVLDQAWGRAAPTDLRDRTNTT